MNFKLAILLVTLTVTTNTLANEEQRYFTITVDKPKFTPLVEENDNPNIVKTDKKTFKAKSGKSSFSFEFGLGKIMNKSWRADFSYSFTKPKHNSMNIPFTMVGPEYDDLGNEIGERNYNLCFVAKYSTRIYSLFLNNYIMLPIDNSIVTPFLLGSIGTSYIRETVATTYINKTDGSILTEKYRSKLEPKLSYKLGIGFDIKLNNDIDLSTKYVYTNYGKSKYKKIPLKDDDTPDGNKYTSKAISLGFNFKL